MTVTVIREQEVLREAVGVLWEHLGPAKAVRLWATWQMGEGIPFIEDVIIKISRENGVIKIKKQEWK